MSKENDFKPLKSTLTITTSEIESPEKIRWNEIENNTTSIVSFEQSKEHSCAPNVRGAVDSLDPTKIFSVALDAVELVGKLTKVVAEPKSITVLPIEDPNPLNYLGNSFRSPAEGVYSKLFWTDSLYPCGYFSFYFNITTKARPKKTSTVEDGFYISNISIVPVSAWAVPLCELNVQMYTSNPIRQETPDGLAIANIDLIIEMHLIKLGIFDWNSKMNFTISGSKDEVQLTHDGIPPPW